MSYSLNIPDFTNHWKLLRAQYADAEGMAVVDTFSQPVWCSSTLKVAAIAKLANELLKKYQKPLTQGKPISVTRGDLKLITLAVLDANKRLICLLVASTASQTDKDGINHMTRAMHRVKTSIYREVSLAHQLDTVSEELGDRYEELNLLYSTENDIRSLDEPSVATAQMIKKTILHLRVDAVCLRIPVRGMDQWQIAADSSLTEAQVSSTVDKVIVKVLETGSAVIANDLHDSDKGALFTHLHYKCLAIPLPNFAGVVDGILIAINESESPSFSNSDSNLMNVIAQRVRWVLESNSDPLTGLLARHAFEKQLLAALNSCQEHASSGAVLNVNIDRLHVVNDICSPQAGDQAICHVGRIVDRVIGKDNHAARLGGDEIGVLLRESSIKQAMQIAKDICSAVAASQFIWESDSFDLSVSVGIGPITQLSNNTDELLSAAEIACDEAKASGGGRAKVLQKTDQVLLMRQDQMRWISKLQAALRESKFVLFAQLIQPLRADNGHLHHEILLRLTDDNGQPISPNEFIPAAERYYLMPAIDRWVIDNFLSRFAFHWEQLSQARRKHELTHSTWAINLSGQSMCDRRLQQFIIERIAHYKIPPEIICFEVTESAAVNSIDDARRIIAALRARGFKFSLDDFGTGVSSFAYLKALPVDYLKIDGSFVTPLLEDIASEAVVSAIAQIAQALQLKTIAEFVENEDIANKLRSIGIDYGQGYCFSKPLPLDDVLKTWAATAEAVSA